MYFFCAISGVKRNRNLGRKFESGASKRRRKAELERKNIELSGSLLKFLKRNDDASVSNVLSLFIKTSTLYYAFRGFGLKYRPEAQLS
jgi:hypothetical protein